MVQTTVTGDNIITSLKLLGFTETTVESKAALVNGKYKILVPKGWLEGAEATRLYNELLAIFKAFENEVQASSDRNLHNVRDWLEARTAKIRNS
jgi:polyhydroxyalkanoate synthesis regulator phasin